MFKDVQEQAFAHLDSAIIVNRKKQVVDISRETPEQTGRRLRRVIKQARLKLYEPPYHFEEFQLADFQQKARSDALALVRDDRVWSQLVETVKIDANTFAVWRFHFPLGADNSGFVGWLASLLKNQFGTGVFVTCGQNSQDGGIFDYWGCPWQLRTEVIGFVQTLCSPESNS